MSLGIGPFVYEKILCIMKKENPSKKWNVFLSEFASTAPVPGIRDGTLLMAFADIRQVQILNEMESFYGVFLNYSLQISFQRCQVSNDVYYILGKLKNNFYIITLCTQYIKQIHVCQKLKSASNKTCAKFVEGIDEKKKQ